MKKYVKTSHVSLRRIWLDFGKTRLSFPVLKTEQLPVIENVNLTTIHLEKEFHVAQNKFPIKRVQDDSFSELAKFQVQDPVYTFRLSGKIEVTVNDLRYTRAKPVLHFVAVQTRARGNLISTELFQLAKTITDNPEFILQPNVSVELSLITKIDI